MKVKYIGAEDAFMSGKTLAFGREFPVGEVVEVSDDVGARCRRNRYFEVVEDDAPEPKRETPQNRMLAASQPASDLDAMPRHDLIKLADTKGVQIDRRWGDQRIRNAIKEAGI